MLSRTYNRLRFLLALTITSTLFVPVRLPLQPVSGNHFRQTSAPDAVQTLAVVLFARSQDSASANCHQGMHRLSRTHDLRDLRLNFSFEISRTDHDIETPIAGASYGPIPEALRSRRAVDKCLDIACATVRRPGRDIQTTLSQKNGRPTNGARARYCSAAIRRAVDSRARLKHRPFLRGSSGDREHAFGSTPGCTVHISRDTTHSRVV